MVLKFQLHVPSLLGMLGSIGMAYSLATGKAQEVVHFADPINEMACFCIAGAMTIGFAISTFRK
jgi:hypothetical protein